MLDTKDPLIRIIFVNKMFGSQSETSGNNRFANVSVNFPPQQPPQQQNQQNAYQQQFQAPSQPQQQVFFQQGVTSQLNATQREPEWFNNPRKRATPQAIVKRTTKRSPSVDSTQSGNESANTTYRSGFNSITFGSKKDAGIFQSTQSINTGKKSDHNTSILIDSNEAPPSISLYDWQREDEFGALVSLPSQLDMNPTSLLQTEANPTLLSSSSSTARKQATVGVEPNAFDKKNGTGIVHSQNNQHSDNKSENITPLTPRISESAVIVFGYPESISNLVISHFSKFGNILEDFEVLRSSSGINTATLRLRGRKSDHSKPDRRYPIFTGDGWVKLTYDSASSAVRALQENGKVFGGSLIGCVPYSKKAVEQLASCHIEKVDDIGGLNFAVAQTAHDELNSSSHTLQNGKGTTDSNILTHEANTQHVGDKSTLPSTPSNTNNILEHTKVTFPTRRLDIKDGKSLFVHNGSATNHNFLQSLEIKMRQQEENSRQQAGILHKVNNWLFGWNEL